MIDLRGIRKVYRTGNESLVALDDIRLHIGRGEFTAVMGASGSGKSTLMNIIGCLDRNYSGEYLLGGKNVSRLRPDELAVIRNGRIGFVFQSFYLLPRMNILENVELPMVYARVAPRERRRRAVAALERVGLADRMRHKPNQISGGQMQRVAIARAIVNRPSVLMADEPTGNLDSAVAREIMELFVGLNREGTTIVMVTHEPDVAQYSHRVIRFKDGRIIGDNPNPEHITEETRA